MSDGVTYSWRDPISDDEMLDLVKAHGGRSEAGWWDRVSPRSLGWVSARTDDGQLVGFVNVAWDGGDHAILLDTKTRSDWQHRGVGTELVRRAARHAQEAGVSGFTWTSKADWRRSTSTRAASARLTLG